MALKDCLEMPVSMRICFNWKHRDKVPTHSHPAKDVRELAYVLAYWCASSMWLFLKHQMRRHVLGFCVKV